MTEGKTGIEIQVGLSPGQRAVGKVLEALHLQKIGEWVAKISHAVIQVDDQEREEPLYEAHFVEAAPGPHHVVMYVTSPGMSRVQKAANKLSPITYVAEIDVTVEPGQVVVLEYMPHDGGGATLELLSTRPA